MFNYKGSITELNDELFNSSSLNSSMNAACGDTAAAAAAAACEDCVPFETGECGHKRKRRDDHHLLKDVQMKATRRARLLGKPPESTTIDDDDDQGINYSPDDLISNSVLDCAPSQMADQESESSSKPCKSFYILSKTTGAPKLRPTPSGHSYGLKYDLNQSSDDTEYENNEADEEDENDDEDEDEEDEEHDKGLFFKFDSHSSSKASAQRKFDLRFGQRSFDDDLADEDATNGRREVQADEADDEQSDWPSNEKSSKPIMIQPS